MRWFVRAGRWLASALTALPIVLGAAAPATLAAQSPVPSPAEVLGYRPGTDSMLADWGQISGYFERLALASPRVRLDTIGRSTGGRPLLLATIASPANQARLPTLRTWQGRLADPRSLTPGAEDSLVAAAPAVVLIGAAIHSTEIGSTQMALELGWRLAAEPAWQRLLDSVVVLLIPSLNPDGVDTVVNWYRRYRGTPYEAGPLPWLYHRYVGHDNNRDWFMLTQVETRAVTRVLYRDWFPQVVWDVHQMGSQGARLFVPPFADPVNPNLDPMVVQAITLVGTAMGTAVTDAGRTGVAHQTGFDLWWHGGFRTVPVRHNMIGILSEAASARLASPIYVHPDSVRGPAAGVNAPARWPGGWWRIGDIVEYELLAAHGLLRLVAGQRSDFVRRFVTLGRRQIARGRDSVPAAFLFPATQRDPAAAAHLINLLIATGIEVRRIEEPTAIEGRPIEAGSHLVPLAQPFRAHVKDLLEPQAYPERRRYPGGPLIGPYDVTGWTLGLQMGVAVETVDRLSDVPGTVVDTVVPDPGRVHGDGPVWVLTNRSNAESRVIALALSAGATAWVHPAPILLGGDSLPAGAVVVEGVPGRMAAAFQEAVREAGFDVWRSRSVPRPPNVRRARGMPRVGLYQPWTASMDEGWTRWVLEQYGIPFTTIRNADIVSGKLRKDIDILVLPDIQATSIMDGHPRTRVPEEYAGGIGADGVRQVTDFVAGGGTLVTLDGSSDFAISALNLPVGNTLAQGGDSGGGSRFSAPGSIFGVTLGPGGLPWTSGMADSAAVFFADSRAYEVGEGARAVLRYADPPLRSGFVEGQELVAGRVAAVEVAAGSGRVLLIGFRPQHRGQTHATFKLLFNAVLFGAAR
jgi:hypothetical protein